MFSEVTFDEKTRESRNNYNLIGRGVGIEGLVKRCADLCSPETNTKHSRIALSVYLVFFIKTILGSHCALMHLLRSALNAFNVKQSLLGLPAQSSIETFGTFDMIREMADAFRTSGLMT